MRHLVLPRRSLLLTAAVVTAVGVAGCQSLLGLDATEQALMASTPIPESSSTPVPTAKPSPMPPTATEPNPTPVPTATPSPMPPTATEPNPTSNLPSRPFEGALAPALTLPDLTGHEVSLRGLKGKAVLLNFWASW